MKRTITAHRVNGLNDAITITPHESGSGGAPSRYDVEGPSFGVILAFQSKPIASPADFNGITNEALLAVIIDRLQCFQAGPFACVENATALIHLQGAMRALHQRTTDRIVRGVEGSHAP